MGSSIVDLDALLEIDLLRTENGEAEGVTEDALLVARLQVSTMGCKVPVSKKVHKELLPSLTHEIQLKCSECEVARWQLDAKVANVAEWELKVRLLMDESWKVGELQRHQDAHEKQLDWIKWGLKVK